MLMVIIKRWIFHRRHRTDRVTRYTENVRSKAYLFSLVTVRVPPCTSPAAASCRRLPDKIFTRLPDDSIVSFRIALVIKYNIAWKRKMRIITINFECLSKSIGFALLRWFRLNICAVTVYTLTYEQVDKNRRPSYLEV